MPDLETGKTEHESNHAPRPSGGGDGAADPPSAMEGWWKTPSSLTGPPAVDPAIYGIDASDTGGSLDAYIGMSNVASAQAGGPNPERLNKMQTSDGHRANAMNAQLRIAAMRLDGLRMKLDSAMKGASDERSPDAIAPYLVSVLADVKTERNAIALVFNEQHHAALNDRVVRDGFLHATRASHLLDLKVLEAQRIARSSGASKADVDALAINSGFVNKDLGNLGKKLEMEGADDSRVQPVDESEKQLHEDSLEQSLDGLHRSTDALALAMREPDAKMAMSAVLPGLLSNTRILKASIVEGMKTSEQQRAVATAIIQNMNQATLDAKGLKLDQDLSLKEAAGNVPSVIKELQKLPKAKK